MRKPTLVNCVAWFFDTLTFKSAQNDSIEIERLH